MALNRSFTVSVVFNTSFQYTSFWYTLRLVNCNSLRQHLRQSFDLTRETVFQEEGGMSDWKETYRLSLSLFPPFFARWLFHLSLPFLARLHWQRAWHELHYSHAVLMTRYFWGGGGGPDPRTKSRQWIYLCMENISSHVIGAIPFSYIFLHYTPDKNSPPHQRSKLSDSRFRQSLKSTKAVENQTYYKKTTRSRV